MKKFKKIISIGLSAMMALSIMCVGVSAENGIATIEELPFVDGAVEVIYKDISERPALTDENGNPIVAEHLHDGEYDISPCVTIYESENNGSMSTADQTYSNYDNVGSISTAGDEDYWKVTFDETGTGVGSANFWLGNVPSNCDFRLTIFEQSVNGGWVGYAVNANGDGGQELLENFDVWTGVAYYIRVDSADYDKSSSTYLMRTRQL